MNSQRLILRGCGRCSGDLLHDFYEDEFRCLACGRNPNPETVPQEFLEVSREALKHHSKSGRRRTTAPRFN